LVGLTFNAVAGLYALYNLRQKEIAISKKDAEGAVESKKLEKYKSPAAG
jgi:hypothetical protein